MFGGFSHPLSPSICSDSVCTEWMSHDSLHPAMLQGMTEMLCTVPGSSEVVWNDAEPCNVYTLIPIGSLQERTLTLHHSSSHAICVFCIETVKDVATSNCGVNCKAVLNLRGMAEICSIAKYHCVFQVHCEVYRNMGVPHQNEPTMSANHYDYCALYSLYLVECATLCVQVTCPGRLWHSQLDHVKRYAPIAVVSCSFECVHSVHARSCTPPQL